jgi:hypothetical protein
MTTILLIKSADNQRFITEVFESIVDTGEDVHLLQLPSAPDFDSSLQETISMSDCDVSYKIHTLPKEDTATNLIEFAIEVNADRICLGILNRTSAGKAQVDELMQSLLLHQRLSGNLTFGEQIMSLEALECETRPSTV